MKQIYLWSALFIISVPAFSQQSTPPQQKFFQPGQIAPVDPNASSEIVPVHAGDHFTIRLNVIAFGKPKPIIAPLIRAVGIGMAGLSVAEDMQKGDKKAISHSSNSSYLLPALGLGTFVSADKLASLTKSNKAYLQYAVYNNQHKLVSAQMITVTKRSIKKNPVLLNGEIPEDGLLRVELFANGNSEPLGEPVVEIIPGKREPNPIAVSPDLAITAGTRPLSPALIHGIINPNREAPIITVKVGTANGILLKPTPLPPAKLSSRSTGTLIPSKGSASPAPSPTRKFLVPGKQIHVISHAPVPAPALLVFHKGLVYIRRRGETPGSEKDAPGGSEGELNPEDIKEPALEEPPAPPGGDAGDDADDGIFDDDDDDDEGGGGGDGGGGDGGDEGDDDGSADDAADDADDADDSDDDVSFDDDDDDDDDDLDCTTRLADGGLTPAEYQACYCSQNPDALACQPQKPANPPAAPSNKLKCILCGATYSSAVAAAYANYKTVAIPACQAGAPAALAACKARALTTLEITLGTATSALGICLATNGCI